MTNNFNTISYFILAILCLNQCLFLSHKIQMCGYNQLNNPLTCIVNQSMAISIFHHPITRAEDTHTLSLSLSLHYLNNFYHDNAKNYYASLCYLLITLPSCSHSRLFALEVVTTASPFLLPNFLT